MTDPMKKIVTLLKSHAMNNDEKDQMREKLLEYMAHTPSSKGVSQENVSRAHVLSPWFRLVPATLIVALVFYGTGYSPSIDDLSSSSVAKNTVMDEASESPMPMMAMEMGVAEDGAPVATERKMVAPQENIGGGDTDAIAMGYAETSQAPDTLLAPYEPPTTSVSDTREFMKTHYNASIQSRDVSDTINQIGFTIEQTGGRLDGLHTSKEYGSISFVIPKSNFFEFKTKVKEIAGSDKLIIENISSDNLLYQKQSIEERTEYQEEHLTSLQEKRSIAESNFVATKARHNSAIADLNNQIIAATNALLKEEDEDIRAIIQEQLTSLNSRLTAEKQLLSDATKTYDREIALLTGTIDRTETTLEHLADEDVRFLDNVETVNGYIDVRYITFVELAQIYSPTPLWLNGIFIVLIGWILFERRRRKELLSLQEF